MKARQPYTPRPICTADLVAQAKKELGTDDTITAMVWLAKRYQNSPEAKAERREFQRQELRRKQQDEIAARWADEREAEEIERYRKAEREGTLPLSPMEIAIATARDAAD